MTDSGTDVDVTLGEGPAGGAVLSSLTTLVLGALLVGILPDCTEERLDAVAVVLGNVSLDLAIRTFFVGATRDHAMASSGRETVGSSARS